MDQDQKVKDYCNYVLSLNADAVDMPKTEELTIECAEISEMLQFDTKSAFLESLEKSYECYLFHLTGINLMQISNGEAAINSIKKYFGAYYIGNASEYPDNMAVFYNELQESLVSLTVVEGDPKNTFASIYQVVRNAIILLLKKKPSNYAKDSDILFVSYQGRIERARRIKNYHELEHHKSCEAPWKRKERRRELERVIKWAHMYYFLNILKASYTRFVEEEKEWE